MDMDKEYSPEIIEIENRINLLEQKIGSKFEKAAELFDYLKEKIVKSEHKLKNVATTKGTIKPGSNISSLFFGGRKHICARFNSRRECKVTNIMRPPGFDLCFDNDTNCDELIPE